MIDLQGYGPSLLEGAWVTVQLAVLAQLLAIALGLLTATAKMSRSTPLRWLATLYTTIIRGVPDIVLMLLLFFGGQIGINMVTDWLYDSYDIDVFVNVDEFTAGVVTIGFIFGAYMGETFRGAFMAVDAGQIEAGRAYGMNDWKVFKRIRFPLMMRHALPGLGNNWMVLLKTTALVSVIGLVVVRSKLCVVGLVAGGPKMAVVELVGVVLDEATVELATAASALARAPNPPPTLAECDATCAPLLNALRQVLHHLVRHSAPAALNTPIPALSPITPIGGAADTNTAPPSAMAAHLPVCEPPPALLSAATDSLELKAWRPLSLPEAGLLAGMGDILDGKQRIEAVPSNIGIPIRPPALF